MMIKDHLKVESFNQRCMVLQAAISPARSSGAAQKSWLNGPSREGWRISS